MSVTSTGIQNILNKSKRKFNIVELEDNQTENSYVELFCLKCGKSLGMCELHFSSVEVYKYCSDCSKEFIKEVPRSITNDITILEDHGQLIVIRYENIRSEETKQCYFSKNGRYIKIKGNRVMV